MIDGEEHRLDADDLPFDEAEAVDLVVDRVSFSTASRARIADAVEQAAAASHGRVSVLVKGGDRIEYSTHGACTICGFQLGAKLEPRHFSFNTHVGACPSCDGLGSIFRADPEKLITDPTRPLADGAIGGKLGRYLVKGKGYYETLLRTVARSHRINLEKPLEKLSAKHQALLLRGVGARASYEVHVSKQMRNFDFDQEYTSQWNGLCGHIDAWHAKTDDPEWAGILERVMTRQTCPVCDGERLAPAYRSVLVGRKRLPQVLGMTVESALAWLGALRLRKSAATAMEQVLAELRSRLALLERVGLGYLTLDRSTATLSGGEARRVRLSASLGSELVGVCYVLDEPTVGLTQGISISWRAPWRTYATRGTPSSSWSTTPSSWGARTTSSTWGPGRGCGAAKSWWPARRPRFARTPPLAPAVTCAARWTSGPFSPRMPRATTPRWRLRAARRSRQPLAWTMPPSGSRARGSTT